MANVSQKQLFTVKHGFATVLFLLKKNAEKPTVTIKLKLMKILMGSWQLDTDIILGNNNIQWRAKL